ncbi:hypothetical protein [Rhizobium etli]|nr:hypothetical protein [Rhizobium etli]
MRIAENFDVFGLSRTAEEIAAINALDTGKRGLEPASVIPETFTFRIPD